MSTDTLDRAPLWDSDRAARLVAKCFEPRGFTTESYGTTRWLRGDPKAERSIWLAAASSDVVTKLVERLPDDIAARFADLSFQLEASTVERDALAAGWSVIGRVPTLDRTVSELVRAIHLLRSPGAGYDVSHSDPALPCSIFLSLPVGETFADLRVAESIVHEAMHLQLSLMEVAQPLVERASTLSAYSPWQGCDRPLTGVIHGLYVFRAIDGFMEALIETGLSADDEAFARKRRREVADEMEQVASIVDAPDLTEAGRALVTALLAPA